MKFDFFFGLFMSCHRKKLAKISRSFTNFSFAQDIETNFAHMARFSEVGKFKHAIWFLPLCMECRRGLAMRILSVCPSVTRVNC